MRWPFEKRDVNQVVMDLEMLKRFAEAAWMSGKAGWPLERILEKAEEAFRILGGTVTAKTSRPVNNESPIYP